MSDKATENIPLYLASNDYGTAEKPKIWIIFSDHTEIWWLKNLRRGFRHCFALMHDGAHWLLLESLAGYLDCRVLPPAPDFNMPAWLALQGLTVKCAETIPRQHLAPLALMTCVETVKRLIGCHRWRIWTPWQLYRWLQQPASTSDTRLFNI